MTVTLTATASHVAVGTPIGWTAQVSGADPAGTNPASVWYRFRVRLDGAHYTMIRDFGPSENLLWAASGREGTYVMEVTALNLATNRTRLVNRSSTVAQPTAYSKHAGSEAGVLEQADS